MDVTAKCEGKELEFQLQGELDHHGAKGLLTCLEREIERTLPMVLVLDFSGVTFMDKLTVRSVPGKGTTVQMRKRIAPRMSTGR